MVRGGNDLNLMAWQTPLFFFVYEYICNFYIYSVSLFYIILDLAFSILDSLR